MRHLVSKCALPATALLPSSICYRLHKTFFFKVIKIMVNLIKASEFSEFNQIIADDNIPTSVAIFFITTVRSILHAQKCSERFGGAL